VRKGQRRLDGLDKIVLGLYAKGMSTRDITAHLAEIYDVDVSPDLISKITDAVHAEVAEWQSRPLNRVYPVIFLDALVCKVRDGGTVRNKAAHLAVGVDVEGRKEVLGIWVETTEGAKFWLRVMNELKARGIHDVLIAVCDGLTGLPEAINAVWPQTKVQTCIVHLIRASLRWVNYNDRKKVAGLLRPIYNAPTEAAARAELDALADSDFGRNNPGIIRRWRDSWELVIPFFDFAPEVRKVIYTTNMIENINSQLRRSTRNRGHFPSDEALLKVLYLPASRWAAPAPEPPPDAAAAFPGRQHSTSSTSCSQAAWTWHKQDQVGHLHRPADTPSPTLRCRACSGRVTNDREVRHGQP
jgi:putative transposase